MPDAVRYHRFSTARQDKGTSLDRQQTETDKLCTRNGWNVIDTLEDKGRSAWKGDHLRVGQLGKFKDRVDAGEFAAGTYLVIENLDRLSRQEVKFAKRWIEDITEKGIIVAVCTPEILIDEESLSGSNIVSMIQYLLEAQRSTGESDRKSDMSNKMIARFMSQAREGVVYSARAPAWLRGVKGGKFELIEERVAIVNQIYEWSASGMGFTSIASRLNEDVEPWNKAHKHSEGWKIGYIRDILKSPAVEGEYHVKTGYDQKPTGEIILGYYPRIVDADLVQRARAAIKLRAGTGGRGRREACNLFAGRVACGHCGDPMVRVVQRNRQKTQYEYLKCSRYNAAKTKCSNSTLYRYDLFERAALDRILALALDNSFFVKSEDISPLAGRVADLTKEVELMSAEQRRLLTFIMKQDDASEYEAFLDELRPALTARKVQLAEAQAALDKAKGQVDPDEHLRRVREVKEAIYSDDPEEREQARRKVRDALQVLVWRVECRASWESNLPERRIVLTLAGGTLAYHFDGHGNEVQPHIDLTTDKHVDRVIEGTGAEAALQNVKRRRLANVT